MQLNPLQPSKIDDNLQSRLLITDNDLLTELRRQYPNVVVFFSLMGLPWPESDWSIVRKVFQYAWSGAMRLFLIWTVGYGLYFCGLCVAYGVSVFVFIGISISLQAAILIPTVYVMHRRLHSKCYRAELEFFPLSIGFSCGVFLFSVVCGAIFELIAYCIAYGGASSCGGDLIKISSAFSGVGQLSVSCMLAMNTLFVLVDSQVSVKLVQELIEAHSDKKMTIAMFNEYRDNIRQRVDSNYWTYNSVLFIAVFNILLMIITVYFHESRGAAAWPLIFIKEIPFVLVALYYSTTVNEQADKLKRLLGTTIWSSKDIEEDHTRLFYFTNAEADSISFPLSGMRLKKKDLLLRVAASSLAFVLGLLRSALVNG